MSELKVNFAPGCFDMFEGTQEELDALQAEILEMFATMTPEELESSGRMVVLGEEMLEDPEFAEMIDRVDHPRTLQ